uniref:Protein kinase-like domain containing n=1 Tax=Oryzias latipes TaxID=8090 RepID=A0A3B3HVA2_ORYLA
MTPEQRDFILQACAASSLCAGATIQSLWSGYGEIVRVHLQGCRRPSVILKHVKFPEEAGRPGAGGGNTDRSHRRKVRSYQVETNWYQNFSTDDSCRIPACLAACSHGDEMLIVLEDLDVITSCYTCLAWLAHFHALFLGVEPEGLWPVGTYWHLETRPDELEAMDDAELKAAAAAQPMSLQDHRPRRRQVAAVDFQYVGGGCGMKDVAYFLGSCMDERECERRVPGLLEHYFSELRGSVRRDVDGDALEKEWREMFAFAWTDFHRFLLGWMPGHWKINRYSKQLTREVLSEKKQHSLPNQLSNASVL